MNRAEAMRWWYLDQMMERGQPPRRSADPDSPDPFDNARLYGDEKYSLQNMLLKSVNAPRRLPADCSAHSVWSDRAYSEWKKAGEGVKSREFGDAWWHGVTEADFLAFLRRIAVELGMNQEVTGGRMVRYTNHSSGYPTLRLDIIYRKPEEKP